MLLDVQFLGLPNKLLKPHLDLLHAQELFGVVFIELCLPFSRSMTIVTSEAVISRIMEVLDDVSYLVEELLLSQ